MSEYFVLILVIFCKTSLLDTHAHSIAPEELFLRGSYLKPDRPRNISQKMFSLVPGDVVCGPDKVFEIFFDIDSNLSMSKDAYLALVARSSENTYFLLHHTVVYYSLFFPYSSSYFSVHL